MSQLIDLGPYAPALAGLRPDVQLQLYRQLAFRKDVDPALIYQKPFVGSTSVISVAASGTGQGSWTYQTLTAVYGISGIAQLASGDTRDEVTVKILTDNGTANYLGTSEVPMSLGAVCDPSAGAGYYTPLSAYVGRKNETWKVTLTGASSIGTTIPVSLNLYGVQLYTPNGAI